MRAEAGPSAPTFPLTDEATHHVEYMVQLEKHISMALSRRFGLCLTIVQTSTSRCHTLQQAQTRVKIRFDKLSNVAVAAWRMRLAFDNAAGL